ncbi:hypothetical protein [Polycladidibacter hongkongensis]|uniref:hypothetical protein n=1 Tax=Polycladidibacter hongkongensis TaxID=1647556 RepID=UPI0008373705|nr:hypothetical protein [Pseudovibrio hongkongensis]
MKKQITGIVAAMATAFLAFESNAQPGALPDENKVRQSYIEHAATAQLFRWYQFYENSEVPIENQLDILSSGVRVVSGLGDTEGHEAYKQRVAAIPAHWKNSHNVTELNTQITNDGSLRIDARIIYQNVGMAEDGTTMARAIRYQAQLRRAEDTLLPKFTEILIKAEDAVSADAFVDRYAMNRLRSLVHYWLALIENPNRNVSSFEEVLTPEFSLDFGREPLTSLDDVASWLTGRVSAVSASRHEVSDFSFKSLGQDRFQVSMNLDWVGILPNDTWMTAKTHHEWVVQDNPKERFPRIESVKMAVLEPFAPVSAEH